MKEEVCSAIKFLSQVLSRNSKVNQEHIQTFNDTLEQLIIARFENHWHPNKPLKGNAFRCINIDELTGIDPVLLKATKASGISPSVLLEIFPGGLALWIDPGEVSCRIGKGSICPIYCKNPQQQQQQQLSSNHSQRYLQPLYLNSGYRQCSQSSYKEKLFPRNFNNKENFDRYHWVSKDYSKRPTEVF